MAELTLTAEQANVQTILVMISEGKGCINSYFAIYFRSKCFLNIYKAIRKFRGITLHYVTHLSSKFHDYCIENKYFSEYYENVKLGCFNDCCCFFNDI